MTGEAACTVADPDLFFPATYGGTHRPAVLAAKALCSRCAIQGACLDRALTGPEEFGIWGGATPIERLRMAHRRRL